MEDSNVKVMKSALFEKKYRKLLRNPQVKKAMNHFLDVKIDDPTQKVGKKDYPFTGNNAMGGVMHCHLTSDISIVYLVKGKNPTELHFIDIGTHRDFGTGTPASPNKFKSLSQRVNNYRTRVGV